MEKEHSVFISYRQIDGKELSTWLFEKLKGHSIIINSESFILSPQMDLAIPSGSDWKQYIDTALSTALTLIVVCSPATMYIDRGDDYFHYEINWWINNRKNYPPILVATEEHGKKYVPYSILDNWINLQVSPINSSFIRGNSINPVLIRYSEIFIESIINGITNPHDFFGAKVNLSLIESPLHNIKGVFAWAKDKNGKYTYVNELYARAAGYDSPKAMLGKSDFDMPWYSLAPLFLEGDNKIMKGDELSRMGVFEKEIMAEKVADIFVTEGVVRDKANRIIGVQGCFVDVTAGLNDFLQDKLTKDEYGIYLGKEFSNAFLSNIEIEVLRSLSLLISKEKIAYLLHKSVSEINSIVHSLQKKLQCSSEKDILTGIIRAGIPLKLFEPKNKK